MATAGAPETRVLRKRTSKKDEPTGRERMRAMLNLRPAQAAGSEAAPDEPEGPPTPLDPLSIGNRS